MMKNYIFNKNQMLFLATVIIVLMFIGSCYDYSISLKLMNQHNMLGRLGEVYGHLPLLWALSVSGSLLLLLAYRNKKGTGKISLGIILNGIAIGKIHIDQMKLFHMSFLLSFVLALSLVLLVNAFFIRLFQNEKEDKIKHIVIFVLVVTLGQLLLVNLIKLMWSRPRMRMISVQSEASFQPWWVIGCDFKETLMQMGIRAEEFKSFPSGHTSAASCCFILCALPLMKEEWKKYCKSIFMGCCGFTFLVAVSRIIMGAHFVSDVTMGFTCTLLVLHLAYLYHHKFC